MSTSGRHTVSNIAQSINQKMHTRRGRNLLSYLLCFMVASVFWLFISLDDVTERSYELSVELDNVPDSVVLLKDVPPSINVVMKGRGTQFLKYYFSKVPDIHIDFRQYSSNSLREINISRAKLDSRIREIFGQNINIIVVSPDSINLPYTTGKGIRVPLRVPANITTSPECVLSGPVVADFDSVTIYMAHDAQRPKHKYAETEALTLDDVSDTTVVEVAVRQVPGMRIIPEKVQVTVPVEMLVAKTASIPVSVYNVAEGERVVTYPATITVQYLVPMRMSSMDISIKATVDFSEIPPGAAKAHVSLSDIPDLLKIVSLSHDSVEYVIEH